MSGCSASGFLTAADARLKSRNDKAIYSEICAIESKMLDAMCNCEGTAPLDITINGGTPFTTPKGISDITIIDGGSGYEFVSPITEVDSLLGEGLEANPVIDQITGQVIAFSFSNNRGLGYALGDVVTVIRPAGSVGADFLGSVSSVDSLGEVLGITIENTGSNYFVTPYLKVIDPQGSGSGFVGTLDLDSNGSIVGVNIVESGRGYSSNSTAVIVGETNGTQAIISTQTESNGSTDNSIDQEYYYKVWVGLVDDKAVKMQIDMVQKYFTDLGYNFIIQVNPVTMNTLQYYISW